MPKAGKRGYVRKFRLLKRKLRKMMAHQTPWDAMGITEEEFVETWSVR